MHSPWTATGNVNDFVLRGDGIRVVFQRGITLPSRNIMGQKLNKDRRKRQGKCSLLEADGVGDTRGPGQGERQV